MKKKLVSICAVVALAAVAVGGATLAYFTDAEEANNSFTVGKVDIELTEPNWDATGEAEAADVYAGEAVAKDPTVKNIAANPCFVRVKVENLDQFGNKGMITYRTNYVDGALGNNWVEYNGYYYYTKVLATGEATNALFDQIVMPKGLEGGETTKTIDVTAEAVQAQGAKPSFFAVQAMTVEEIADWFGVAYQAE